MSLPLVLTDLVGCVPDLLFESQNGFVAKAESAEDLAASLIKMLDCSKDILRRFGAISRQNFENISSLSINEHTIQQIVNG